MRQVSESSAASRVIEEDASNERTVTVGGSMGHSEASSRVVGVVVA